MRIRLLKSWTNSARKYPIGQLLTVTNGLGKQLLENNTAVEYKGEYPPKKLKVKTDFFKPK